MECWGVAQQTINVLPKRHFSITPTLHHSVASATSPVSRPPEGEAKKHQTAKVDAGNVAKLVNPARIVRSVNRRILSDQQSRQGHGHQGPVQHAESEAGH